MRKVTSLTQTVAGRAIEQARKDGYVDATRGADPSRQYSGEAGVEYHRSYIETTFALMKEISRNRSRHVCA